MLVGVRAYATTTEEVIASGQRIAARLRAPNIPARDFFVAHFGAKADGRTNDSEAIQRALKACHAVGGGRIVLARGVCLSGPIRLRSNMELHIPRGAVLRFIPDPELYLPPVLTRWEGVELMGYHPPIYAFDESDVAVTGGGVIDGGATDQRWWPWKGPWSDRFKLVPISEQQVGDRTRLFQLAEEGVPPEDRIFGRGSRLRPPLFQAYHCRDVLIEQVTIRGSPFWLLHPVECERVWIRHVRFDSHGPNNDGIDPESCSDVLIEHCDFDTGDDCIALKSGRNADGRRIGKPCQNVVVRHCRMNDGHGGIAIGSEMSGDIRDIYVHDCLMSSPALSQVLVIKTNGYRGGTAENIHLARIRVGTVAQALVQIWLAYEEGTGGDFVPHVRNVSLSDCTIQTAGRILVLRGRPDSPIQGLSLSHIDVRRELSPSVISDTTHVELADVVVAAKSWSDTYLKTLPGADTLHCDQWAFCD